jgi:hypothetical protein
MAKSKQDYFNAGFDDAMANNQPKLTGNGSWQAQCYSNGRLCALTTMASETEAQCIDLAYETIANDKPIANIIPWWSVLGNKFLGWCISTSDGKFMFQNPIKRKTHARNIAIKHGYRVS